MIDKENGMKQKQFAAFAVIRHNVATGSEFIDLKSIDETEGGAVLQSHYRRMSDS